ncbi:endopeptidase [Hyalangium gracile]|uniref:endopeptidase n=1 Tax=Hyalangium gracile TaxID=394092 RepID=UPI001CCF3627|nr:endopeptidase [Hyalangium gracile]
MRHTMKLIACLALLIAATSQAIVPPESGPSSLSSKAFFKPELYLPIINTPLKEAQARMSSLNASAWSDFFARNGRDFNVYVDLRTGSASSIQGVIPLIPGTGTGNTVSLSSLRQQLGRPVAKVDAAVVGDLIVKFIADNHAAIGVDPLQLGEPRVTQVSDTLWQVHIPQQVNGIPVRHARVAATINSGNLILLGTEAWAHVSPSVSLQPRVKPEEAMGFAGDALGFFETPGELWQQPTLEVLSLARAEQQNGHTFTGNFGVGYNHRLVWTYGFQRTGELEHWKVSVDAQTGELLSFEDTNSYLDASVKGGIYPSTNTEICPSDATCGTLQLNSPMPWTNTGLPAPNDFTDGAGVYDYSGSGTVTTTLSGKYVKINDSCGAVTFSAAGTLDLGGVNGHHDCTTGGGGAGNTASARSCFYELNKLKEQARGWLPTNTWLQGQLVANVNLNQTCNAFWDSLGQTVNFYRSGGGCRNTGEIGAVFDHEWGHGIDNNDANGTLSSSSEGYADIAANYRLQASCVGHGFFHTSDRGCGQTADGTGFNVNEARTGSPWCATDCSGVRDSDYAKHNPPTPQTPANFSCSRCDSGSGPCGRQVHCSAGPTRQAAWDFVARDLRAPPFNLDAQSAFLVGNKVFYQGSGNVGSWHGCDCNAGTSDGCGATNGYMQWLAADDDDGNLANGTPHMTAIYAAFNRHGIACNTPAPVDGGCATNAPKTAPAMSATAAHSQVDLSWSSVPGASQYWVMKTEGFAGCNFGNSKIATVTGTSYTDPEVANDRSYCYSVVAAGSSSACYTPASTCTCVTPGCLAPTISPVREGPLDGSVDVQFTGPLDWNDVEGVKYDVQVSTDPNFTTIARAAQGLTSSEWAVTPALEDVTTYYWRVRAVSSCGGATPWTSAGSFTTRACVALGTPSSSSPADGATGVAHQPSLDWSDVPLADGYDVQVALDSAFNNVVASASGVSDSSWTVSSALVPNTTYYWRARAKDSCSEGSYTTASFTTANVCSPSTAIYNPNFKTPYCASGCGCDTGTLVRGRGSMYGGVESNRPNTLGGTCADGNAGTFHVDESIDKLVLKSVDRSTIMPGTALKLDVSVWCQSGTDRVDLYYTTNAASPSWTPLVTGLACTGSGPKVFSQNFNAGSTPGTHAVRAQIRYGGVVNTCAGGSYNERDDLAFTVVSPLAQTIAPGSTTQGRGLVGR